MSVFSVRGEQSTSDEITALTNLAALSTASAGQFLYKTGSTTFAHGTPAEVGLGTITSISVVNANGVSAVITNPTSSPSLTFTLGAITPSSVVSSGAIAVPSGTFAAGITYQFGATDTGIWGTHSGDLIGLSADGNDNAVLQGSTGFRISSLLGYNFSSGAASTVGADLQLNRYAAKQLLISGDGTGATTNAGWIAGYFGTSTQSGIWSSTVVPGTTNHTLFSDGANTYVNSLAGTVGFTVSGNTKLTATASTVTVIGGTATTDVNALAVTQTWNAAGVAFTGLKLTITDTASAAGALAMQVFGGAAGTTELFKVGKGGNVTGVNTIATNSLYSTSNTAEGVVLGVSSDANITRIGAGILGVGTGAAASFAGTLQLTNIELGHASDTTITRTGAGAIAVEGTAVLLSGGALGTPSSGTLTNCTGLPASGIVSGTTPASTVITLGENSAIALDPAGSADGKFTGITITGTGGATIAFGRLVYLKAADSQWYETDADATATGGAVMVGMTVSTTTDNNPVTILLQGQIRADASFPALTVGAPVYVGETAGDIQVAIPTGADNVIKVVGWALTADEIYFNPSQDWQITVA